MSEFNPSQVLDDVLAKPNDVTQATEQHKENLEKKEKEKQEDNNKYAKVIDKPEPTVNIKPEPLKRTAEEKSMDKLTANLKIYKESNVIKDRAIAFSKVVEAIVLTPKKSILDVLLKFFKENINEPFLHPMNALQGIDCLTVNTRIKVECVYRIFHVLAKGKKNIDITVIRNVIGSDDIVNYIALQLNKKF